MFRTLMTSRRFAPLFWCQFFSAFNDNFVRNMLVMLILFRFGGENASLEILLATIVFILPSIPLSALGGEIADSHDKALIARRLKFVEIFVQVIAAAGFAFSSPALLYVALFGLGVIAALFGPIKYGCPTICAAKNSSPATRWSRARPSRRSSAASLSAAWPPPRAALRRAWWRSSCWWPSPATARRG